MQDYFAVLETKKEENRDKKLGLLKDIESFPAGKTVENTTVIQLSLIHI